MVYLTPSDLSPPPGRQHLRKVNIFTNGVITDQTNFIGISQNCKYFGEFLDIQIQQKRHRAQKMLFLGLEYEKYENHIAFLNSLKNI